jgi:hypothetical protein
MGASAEAIQETLHPWPASAVCRIDLQHVWNGIALRLGIDDVEADRQIRLGQERHQELPNEVGLQLVHIEVIAIVVVAVPVDIQVRIRR